MCFSVNFTKFLSTPFLQNSSGRLLLLVKAWNNYLQKKDFVLASCSKKGNLFAFSTHGGKSQCTQAELMQVRVEVRNLSFRNKNVVFSLNEKCQNTDFFLVCIFTYSVRKRENTDQKKLRIWTLFTQCWQSKRLWKN